MGFVEQREFARIPVSLRAHVRQLDEAEADRLREQLETRPSVWAPRSEAGLRDLVSSSAGSNEAVLAQAVLDLVDQVVQLRAKLLDRPEDLIRVNLDNLSGGGGRINCELPLQQNELLEIRFEDREEDMPPVRAVAKVVYVSNKPAKSFGFQFEAIHKTDRERLIRLLYQFQRRALRRSAHGRNA